MNMQDLCTAAHAEGSTAADYIKDGQMDKDLTVRQVGALTAQSPAVIGRLIRKGYFPNAYKAGEGESNAPWRVPYADVQDYRKRLASRSSVKASAS